AAWHRREQDRSAIAGWRYQAIWTPVSSSGSGSLAGPWLIVVPAGPEAAGELATGCVAALTAHGATVTVLGADPARGRPALTGQLRGLTGPPPAGVLSLLA